jgi:hypothetical protein
MVKYMQWHKEHEVSDAEFIQYARRNFSYKVPTFKQAFKHLIRSLVRQYLINKAIPNVQSAYDYLESHELIGRTSHDGIELDRNYD